MKNRLLTTGQQTTDQGQQDKGDSKQGAVGSEQEKGQQTTEISKTVGSRQLAAGQQSEKSTTDYGLQTTGLQDQEAKRRAQSAKQQQEVAPRANALPADRIW